jgi:hypothetical protein
VLTSKTPTLRGLSVLLGVLREIMNRRKNALENYLLPDGAGGSSSRSRCSSCCLCGGDGGFLDEFWVSGSVKWGEDMSQTAVVDCSNF